MKERETGSGRGNGNGTGREIGSANESANGTGRENGIEIGKETERRVAPLVTWSMHLSGDQVCFAFLPAAQM